MRFVEPVSVCHKQGLLAFSSWNCNNAASLSLVRRRKVAEEMSQSLKNSMVESFNRISSSMSGLMAGSINSKARQSSYTVGRGSGAPASRGPGMGRGAGRRRSRGGGLGPRGRGGNPPGHVDTTKGNKTHQNPKASSANKARHKKQRKRKDKGTVRLGFIMVIKLIL